jgi:hypothetical protein
MAVVAQRCRVQVSHVRGNRVNINNHFFRFPNFKQFQTDKVSGFGFCVLVMKVRPLADLALARAFARRLTSPAERGSGVSDYTPLRHRRQR